MHNCFVMIKPDATERRIEHRITRLLEREVRAVAHDVKYLKLDRTQAEFLYAEHADKPHFKGLVDYTCSGDALLLWLVPGAGFIRGGETSFINQVRNFVGSSKPELLKKGSTLRSMFALDQRRNSIHASDSPEAAQRELCFFFGASMAEMEIFNR